MNQREHRLQAFAYRFIDRVVLPPFFTSGIDHASMTTDNARARAAGRGIKFGLADCFVVQSYNGYFRILFIEYKRGTKVSGNQQAVADALAKCGVPTENCNCIAEVFWALRKHGFDLHGNADNIVVEVEAKLDAADRAAELKTPKRPTKPRAAKAPAARVAKFEAMRRMP